ncbi:csn-1 [Pristionchus pacificus]|uniref:Csn-1 n=1 Tax=Pristionchus pacificus TaxID=54126 RepID=A0A2A6C0F5_PRIPA|nr:csn-1 [Pristionchus pacificus]|eukprot:PDM71664.1 csn-1 [Pristionchus pacificus]
MLFHLLGLALLVSSTLADSPLYIDELEDLVRGPDRHILDAMDDDDYTPRAELKVKLDEILARQSPSIQKAFEHIVELKETQRLAKNNHWQARADDAGVGNLYEKIKHLQTDMTINELKAKSRARQLWYEMNIRHGSHSSEEGYRFRRSSPEDAPDPVQQDRIDEADDVIGDDDDDYPMDRSREDEDPFVPARRGFRHKFLRMDEEFGAARKKKEEKDRKTPEPRFSAKSPVAAVKVHNAEAVHLKKLSDAYEPNAFVNRIDFIMDGCPPLEKECFLLLVNFLKETKRNAQKYHALYTRAETRPWGADADIPPMDKEYYELTHAAASSKTDSLLHELKKQKDEGVKESTRRAMEDLVVHYSRTGQLTEAFKAFNRGMREYCTQMRHVITMYTTWLETAVLLFEWHRVSPLISQSERALQEAEEAENQANGPGGRLNRNQYDQVEASRKTNKLLIAVSRSKLNAIVGLSSIEQKNYKHACERFLQVEADHLSEPWLLAPFDIARYGSLCALATLERSEMKAKCLDSKFRKMLETEPLLVEALTCYTRSQFTRFFEIINGLQDTMLLDPYFSSHVARIYELIKKRALAQYLAPFAVADLGTMAGVFGMKQDELCTEIISLIDKGVVKGRFDERAGIIEMLAPDERAAAHQKLADTCERVCARAEYTVLRALIQSNKVFVSTDDSKPARGKRRTNDENHREETAGGGGGGIMRNMRSTMMRMVRGGAARDTGSSSSSNREPSLTSMLAPLGRETGGAGVGRHANEADSSAEGEHSVSGAGRVSSFSTFRSHHAVSQPQSIPTSSSSSSSHSHADHLNTSSAMEAEPSEPHH